MLINMFAIFDSKAGAYLQPFFSQSRGVALRSFMGASADASHDFNKYPEDFSLVELGEFDQESGKLVAYSNPTNLGSALQLSSQTNNTPSDLAERFAAAEHYKDGE